MSNDLDQRARGAVRAFLDIKEGDPLPQAAVADLTALSGWVDQTLRTAVLDRRMTVDTWAEIADDLGVSAQAARKKYLLPGQPRLAGEMASYSDRDAYYDAHPALSAAWNYRKGDSSRGMAPFGSDETNVVVDEQRWAITVSAPPGALRFDSWRRIGTPDHYRVGDVVATNGRGGAVVVVGQDVPIGPAARALRTIQGAQDLQAVADAIATECGRRDAVQPDPGEE